MSINFIKKETFSTTEKVIEHHRDTETGSWFVRYYDVVNGQSPKELPKLIPVLPQYVDALDYKYGIKS